MAVTSTIGTASRNYSTIQAWEDAIPATPLDHYIGECYNDTEFVAVNNLVTFSGITTSVLTTVTLKCAAGQSFRDHANVQTNSPRYTPANGVALRGNQGTYTNVIIISINYLTLDGLQIAADGAGANGGKAIDVTGTGSTNNVITNCIIEGNRNAVVGVGIVTMVSGTIINCIVVQNGTGTGFSVGYPAANTTILNCTIVKPSDSGGASDGVEAQSGTTTVLKNSAVFGFATSVNNAARFTGNNNASDKAIGFGTSNQASKTYANQFINTAAATRDFRLKTGADCIDTGATEAAASPDIAGTVRPDGAAYDIGCWELVTVVLRRWILGTH